MDVKNTRKILSLAFIIFIAVIFAVQFGATSDMTATNIENVQAIAKVNGVEIPTIEYRRAYRNRSEQYRGRGLPPSLMTQVGSQVLDELVLAELLAQEAARRGIAASDEEILDNLKSSPVFQKDGAFDVQTYKEVVWGYFRKTPEAFEKDLRKQLAADKLLGLVRSTAEVSSDEIRARFESEGNKGQVVFVQFAPSMFMAKAPQATPDEIKKYREENAKDIEQYYNENRFRYSRSEQVKLRHILIRVPANASAAAKGEARQKAENLRKEIDQNKKDFAELAGQFTEDAKTRGNGGDLGFITALEAETWGKPFSDAAFSLKPTEVSPVTESTSGFHLIKLEEKRPPEAKPLAEVQDEIAKEKLKSTKAKEMAQSEAMKTLAAAKSGKDLKTLYPPDKDDNKAVRFEAPTTPHSVETDEFSASHQNIPKLGPAPEIVADVFARKEPAVLDKVYNQGDGFVVIHLIKRTKPTDVEFEGQKQKFSDDARRDKQYALQDEFVTSLKERASIMKSESAIAEIVAGDS